MHAFTAHLTRLGAKLSLYALFTAGAGLVLMTIMVAWGVFGRYVLNDTPIWVEAGSLFLMSWFILLGAAVGVRESDHLGFEVGLVMSPPPVRAALILIGEGLVCAFGIAMLVYVEGRNTQDIDLIVPRDALEKLSEIVIEDDNPDFARAKLDELQVDLLFTHNDLFNTVAKNHTVTKQFVERSIPCATVEAIIMLKLFALPSLYRQGRFEKVDLYQNDVLRLLREFDQDTQPVFAELARHMLPSDVEELQKIVTQIEEEIAQARHRFGNGEH